MRSFVTGASGHLGANLVRQLLERGEHVRVLVRPQSDNRALEGLEVERVEGDLREGVRLHSMLEGCDRLYHLAAMVSIRSMDRRALYEANVLATRRLMRAAKDVGVSRVVHCSSFGTIATDPTRPSHEGDSLGPFDEAMAYDVTKVHAENEVRSVALEGLDVRIVNPSAMVGPWDYKPSMIGRTILELAAGKMRAYVPGAHDFVPVRDVARGHILAMERGEMGQRYLLTGEQVSIDQILDWLCEFTQTERPRWAIPPSVALRVASVKDWVEAKLLPHRHPTFNRHSIHLLQSNKRADNGKARRALDWTPGPLREAFRDHVEWFRARGFLATESSCLKRS